MPLEIVFLEPQNRRPLKPHYYIPITAFTAQRGFVLCTVETSRGAKGPSQLDLPLRHRANSART